MRGTTNHKNTTYIHQSTTPTRKRYSVAEFFRQNFRYEHCLTCGTGVILPVGSYSVGRSEGRALFRFA